MNIHQYRSLDLNDPLMKLGAKVKKPQSAKQPKPMRFISKNVLEIDGMLQTTIQANYGVPLDKPKKRGEMAKYFGIDTACDDQMDAYAWVTKEMLNKECRVSLLPKPPQASDLTIQCLQEVIAELVRPRVEALSIKPKNYLIPLTTWIPGTIRK